MLKRCRQLSSKLNFPETQHIDNWALASPPAKPSSSYFKTQLNSTGPPFASYILPVFGSLYFAFYILFKNLKYNQLKSRQISPVQSYIFSCPEQLNRWPLSVCVSDPTNNQSLHDRATRLVTFETFDQSDLWKISRVSKDVQILETTTAIKTILGFVTLITILTIENLNSWQSL